MIVSFVIPIFNCEGNIIPLFEELQSVSSQFPMYQPEFIFVNDHSTDSSLEELQTLSSQHVKIVGLSKNIGAYSAVLRGLEHVTGERVIVMAGDGQDDPVVAFNLIGMTNETGLSGAFRLDSSNGILATVFHKLITQLTAPSGSGRILDIVVFPSELISKVLSDPRCNAHLFYGLDAMVKTKMLFEHSKRKRAHGTSGWTIQKKIRLTINCVWVFTLRKFR
ncbi:MAG: glucosyltransferase [Bacteroidia bacterium]|jgi:glucosyltransferase